jgi:Protein of unknown function (DUF4065)
MNQAKFDILVHYICARCGDPADLGVTKLNKILWYSDTGAYLAFGRSITDARYIKRQFGPVPEEIMAARQRLAASGAVIERQAPYFGLSQIQLIALTRPDLSLFTAEEISLVDQVIEEVCRNHTAKSISGLTHDQVWESAKIGEELPLYTIFAARSGELTESDVEWATKEMLRLEPHRTTA